MIIDVIITVLVILAFRAGYKRGVVYMIFFLGGIVLGVLAALRLSSFTSEFIQDQLTISPTWIPVLALVINFVVVFYASQFIAGAITKLLKLVYVNIFNKLGGGAIGVLAAFSLLSVGLWYLRGLHVIGPNAFHESAIFPYAMDFAPKVVRFGSEYLPFAKNLWNDLQQLFDNFSIKLSEQTT